MVADNSDAVSLDPAVAYEFTSTSVDMICYETLIRYADNDFAHPLPGLAERWDISPDGRKYTFHLRAGDVFSSGRPVDAEAVRFSLERTLELGLGPAEILSDNLSADQIRVLDPLTVEMSLKAPCSYFLSTLYNPAAAVVDAAEVRAHEHDGDRATAWLADHSAGSGPFVLTRWERDIAITLARNERYVPAADRPVPRLRRVIIKDIKESTTQKMMLERGDIDMAYDQNPLQLDDLRARGAAVDFVEGPFLRLFYLGMNVDYGPLRDVRVRQAIRAAIDYDGLVKYLARGHAIRLEGPIIKGLLGYREHLGVYRYDPLQAKALLTAAGYPTGFDIALSASGGGTSFGPTREDICAKIQSDLAAVGIRAQVKMLSNTAYLDLYRARKTELNMGDWGADFPDPHNFAYPFGDSNGSLAKRVNFKDESLDPLIDEAGRQTDAAAREKTYATVQEKLMQSGPWAILLQPTRVLPVRREVHGYRYDAMNPMNYATVYKAEP